VTVVRALSVCAAPFPYPLPGTKQTFERFGATPASARALYRSLAAGEAVLLFPGGAREVFKRKNEQYTLFWPDDPDFVRLAARVNAVTCRRAPTTPLTPLPQAHPPTRIGTCTHRIAIDADPVPPPAACTQTLIPFSGLGGDDSFSMALDSDEILATPAVGPFFEERIAGMPSLVADDKFVPPFGMITPAYANARRSNRTRGSTACGGQLRPCAPREPSPHPSPRVSMRVTSSLLSACAQAALLSVWHAHRHERPPAGRPRGLRRGVRGAASAGGRRHCAPQDGGACQ
jgi:hypothetical protein